MRLAPREIDHLLLANAGHLAQRRLARGLRLNAVEATALIASQALEFVREGKTVAEVMDIGQRLLGRRQVLQGVPDLVTEVAVEGTFPDGTKLVSVHTPLARDDGDLALALHGSFLPIPDLLVFGDAPKEPPHGGPPGPPGEVRVPDGAPAVELSKGRRRVAVSVRNAADRPVQVGSHFHFAEANPLLHFDRREAVGRRLDVAAGTAVRFEPGEEKTVTLVDIAGKRVVRSGNGLVAGPADMDGAAEAAFQRRVREGGFGDIAEPAGGSGGSRSSKRAKTGTPEVATIPRAVYAKMYGPTTGDLVRLGDTALWVRVEKDYAEYGDECKFGGGKVLREGMGQATGVADRDSLDVVITNALVLDWTGVYKADIGIKNGLIAGIGKAGNPDVMAGVSPAMVVGVCTECVAGEGLILTAGGIDAHVHFICPQLAEEALASGLTTMIGGGTGPATGTNATTCTPGRSAMRHMLRATDALPLNFGFTGKGNASDEAGLHDQVEAGAIGLKLHEDWGTTPSAIDTALRVADRHDVQITIHTDTLNEAGCVEHTVAAIKGRTIHTYHTEGAGGGHAPDIIKLCAENNVLPSSTNPTMPFTSNTVDEHLDMLMVCHHLSKDIAEDVAFAESRIRGETIAAEDILHDMGALSMISSDSQAMGRVGEVVTRTWQTAHKMKVQRGSLKEDAAEPGGGDNLRARRYVAKYTINPAIAHGVAHIVGSVEVGKLADLVLWRPAYFASKPELVIKGGIIVAAQMGDPNASIPTPEPVLMRPMFGALGGATGSCCKAFVSQALVNAASGSNPYGLSKEMVAVKQVRSVSKKDMKLNDATPKIEVDPETYKVTADGVHLTCEPAKILPCAQKYFLF